jgi:hypothetical protein
MPPKNRLRLNHLGRTEQARPEPGHPYQQRPVTAAQSKTRRCLPQSDVELILAFKPAPRLEQVGDEHPERVQETSLSMSDDSAFPLVYLYRPFRGVALAEEELPKAQPQL